LRAPTPSAPPAPPPLKVVLSSRLLDSPCALVTSKFGWSANMERIMKSQAMGDARAMEYMRGRKILELNPEHDVVRGIKVGGGLAGAGGAGAGGLGGTRRHWGVSCVPAVGSSVLCACC
jgi:hypothetical protein